MKHFKEVRAKEIAFLEQTKADLRNHIADNPALDAMDAYQWIIFNGAHSKRHTAQIEEVKTAPIIRRARRRLRLGAIIREIRAQKIEGPRYCHDTTASFRGRLRA